ncbi:MAG: YvcK family protein, partial [Nocardia sp.]|nr:YvcK family protein [Nocardia sp.]
MSAAHSDTPESGVRDGAGDIAVAALGGGHGLYATLSALRRLTSRITAVVTVADDGGSSGRLRAELGTLPPGDLRMALAALAQDPEGSWASTVQHRFGGRGALAGHSVGNLLLAGLSEVLGDPVAALDHLAMVLNCTGRVLPMSPTALTIEADVSGLEADPRVGRCIRGQVAVATTPG